MSQLANGTFCLWPNYTPSFAMNPSVEKFLVNDKITAGCQTHMSFKHENKRLKQQKLTLEKSTKLLDHK